LRYATVEAPIEGRILDVDVEEGSAVASVTGGTPLLSIAADETLHLEGLVDENEIAKIALDQRARVTAEGTVFAGAPLFAPGSFVTIVTVMVVAGISAGVLPAMRASRIEPAVSLRSS
jgi:multidrug resistance efflux pump